MDKLGLSDESDLRDELPELEYEDVIRPLDFERVSQRQDEQTFEHDFEEELDKIEEEEPEIAEDTDLVSLEEWLNNSGEP